ncbi:MAG TPA: TIGR01777 family protein [Planctomycetes bacterium]|nr:TIGR01777 family protein [Planctomycetota bacterium]
MAELVRRAGLPVSAEEAFAWHERPGAVERLLPPSAGIQVAQCSGTIRDGDRVKLQVSFGGVKVPWVLEYYGYEPGRRFCERQIEGVFARWSHEHRFEPDGPDACFLEDRIDFQMPGLWPIRSWAERRILRGLEKTLRYRHDTVAADLAEHARWRDRPRLRIAVTGSSGLIGSALVPFLTTGGHSVQRLVRGRSGEHEGHVVWDPETGQLQADRLQPLDAVIHLAGENLAAGRWTAERKERIRASRVEATRRLCQSLARLLRPPRVLVVASAIGYYGDRGDELLDETSRPGRGFLADLCRDWEAASRPARSAGIRVVVARFGLVLSPRGGSLAKMLTPFRFGLGGRLGGGGQFWSWISLDDVLGALLHAIMTDELEGPVNFVAPEPVTNAQFTRTLARVLRRPAVLPVPAWALRIALGEMAREMVLPSARVVPRKLEQTGYPFRHRKLEWPLRHLLGRQTPE